MNGERIADWGFRSMHPSLRWIRYLLSVVGLIVAILYLGAVVWFYYSLSLLPEEEAFDFPMPQAAPYCATWILAALALVYPRSRRRLFFAMIATSSFAGWYLVI